MPASTSTFGRLIQEIARFRRRATEHVGENGDAVAGIDAVYRFYDVAATEIGIVLGPDRDRLDLLLRTHDVLERRLELVGEAPMGHQY